MKSRITVLHSRYKDRIHVAAYVDYYDWGRSTHIFSEEYPSMNAKSLSKLKLRLKRALELRYQ